jgi:twinkle protein
MHQTESEFLYHSSCDSCGSSDANSIYDDGHSFCFSCNTNKRGVETLTPPTQTEKVSIKTGAAGAKKDIQKSLDFLEGYENVIFMFDQDEQGQKAAIECAKLLTPSKAKIASLPLKDPNEMLLAGQEDKLVKAMWDAKPYRPDGIVLGSEIFDEIMKEDNYVTAQYPFKSLNDKTHGLRKGELTTITAGTGVGKSSFCRHVALDLLKQGFGVGYIALEESIKRSALGIMGVHLKKPLHLTREGISETQLQETFKSTIGNGNFYLYNHFGNTVADSLLNKIRYLAKSCEVDFVVLDHLHMALSALGDEHTNDERKLIDYFVSKLRTLVEETGIGVNTCITSS